VGIFVEGVELIEIAAKAAPFYVSRPVNPQVGFFCLPTSIIPSFRLSSS